MRPCPICGTRDSLGTLWSAKIDMWDSVIVQCPTCSLGYVDKLPTLEQLEAFYSEEFFKGLSSYADYVGDKESLQRNFRHRIATLRQFSAGGKLYEAGCAHGFFLEIAQQYWEVSGSDISASAIAYARDTLGLNVFVGDLETHPPQRNTYDVIAMWDTIEHLYDPVKAVETCAAALKTGGILALTTGDIQTFLPRLQKRRWRLIHPGHLYYFSRQSITYLCEHYGLDIVHFSHPGNSRSLRQFVLALTYGHTKRNWRHRLAEAIQKLPLPEVHIPLNTFDIMFVVARKS